MNKKIRWVVIKKRARPSPIQLYTQEVNKAHDALRQGRRFLFNSNAYSTVEAISRVQVPVVRRCWSSIAFAKDHCCYNTAWGHCQEVEPLEVCKKVELHHILFVETSNSHHVTTKYTITFTSLHRRVTISD